jgi:mono/diheme cytochrome c family protein
MKAAGAIVVGVVIALVAAVASAFWYVRSTGLRALPMPSPIEARAARSVRSWALPTAARDRRNPVAPSGAVLAEGRAHFADHCASCHANDGSGDTEMGRNLFPKSPDMRQEATQSLTDGELFWIIENGIRFTGMPGWGTGTPEGEQASWHLVHFIRHLPRITANEIEQMEAMNPRPPAEVRRDIEAERFLRGETP